MASAAPSVPCVAAAHGLRLAMARQPLPLIARARVIRRVGLTLLALIAGEAALEHGVVPPPLVRTVPVGQGPTALALDQRTHRVFVANSDDNTVSVLDADRGTLLRTVAVGRYPDAVAVDARTG